MKLFSLKLHKRIAIGITIACIFNFYFFPMPTLANTTIELNVVSQDNINNIVDFGPDIPDFDLTIDPNSIIYQNDQPVDISAEIAFNTDEIANINHLPENSDKPIKRANYYIATAYNSEAAQTDASPCITANGFNLCEHGIEDTVAANFLPFGAKVRMPELFGDRIFIVRDRMNKRYQNRLDIWMVSKPQALKFGVRSVKIEILE